MDKNTLKFRKLGVLELNRRSIEEMKGSEKIPLVIILDNIRSLHNVGSVFRTADAFNIEQVILCGITAKPPHREIQKTALGATESVNWKYANDTLSAVKELAVAGYRIIGVEQTENSIVPADLDLDSTKYAVILGNEVNGVDQAVLEICDSCLEIPQDGTKHSLNISVAAGIIMWHFFNSNNSKDN